MANGPREVRIRPNGNDTITRGTLTHTFSNFLRVSTGGSVTIVRSGSDSWNVTVQSGNVSGGS